MAGCVYIWEFRVQPDCVEEFEKHYGPTGSWALLFRQAEGYIETLLLKDAAEPLRYVTIDRWRSEDDYRAFRSSFALQYAALDRQCESLTARESELGRFIDLVAGSAEHEE
jgi:heme-degrading monooxygenase HmoA